MREYFVTTNTAIVIEAPALTVTVRTAFFNTKDVLPADDAGVVRGAETWGGEAVLPSFQISGPWTVGAAVTFKDVVGLDGKTKIIAKKKERRTGIVMTDVPTSARLIALNPRAYPKKSRAVGEAKIPLFGLKEGFYVLAVLPPDKQVTKPDEPAGPKTTMEAGQDRTYRKLYVLLQLDAELRLKAAETVLVDAKGMVTGNPDLLTPDGKKVGKKINHGYVAAFSPDQLAIDIKPDFARSKYTDDGQKAAAESGKYKRKVDTVVVHCTAGPIIAGAYSTMIDRDKKNYGPHYELDLDGHNVKYAYDDAVTWHAGPSKLYSNDSHSYQGNINAFSIGIENVNKPHAKFLEHQIVGLIALIEKLKAAHPAIKRDRIVGHGDVKTMTDKSVLTEVLGLGEGDTNDWSNAKVASEIKALKGTQLAKFNANRDMMDQGKRTCPGRQMDWPRLEEKGLGREHVEKTLTAADYSGFFGITLADFPPKYPKRPTEELYLKKGDSDAKQVWGGVDFSTAEAKELLKKKNLTLKGVVAEMQKDVQTLGYSINTDGEFNDKTEHAVEHMIWHSFSGSRRLRAPNGNSNAPRSWITKTVASFLKGAAEKIVPAPTGGAAPAGGAAAPGTTAPAGGAAAPPATAPAGGTAVPAGGTPAAPPQHAELETHEPEPEGMDMHDYFALMEAELAAGAGNDADDSGHGEGTA